MGAESPSPLSSAPSVIQCPHQRPHLTPSPCLTHVPHFVLIVGRGWLGLGFTLQHVHLVCSLCLSPPPISTSTLSAHCASLLHPSARPPCLLTVPLSSTHQHVHLVCSLCLSPPPISTSTLSAHCASLLHPSARPPCLLTVPLSSTHQHVHLVCSLCLSPPPISTSTLSAHCASLLHPSARPP